MESPETKIQVLQESVASQIAAGEVVERPASVVKELLDNSLDAGSTVITVDIVDGGKALIRVSDDGEGMSQADAVLACRRFATSKLRHHHDLAGIATYGFRGEALPSIAAVSRFRMLTARHHALSGTFVVIEGGDTSPVEERGAAPGTRIEVEELFFNTPGRRKFLKTTTTEGAHIAHVVQQAALVNISTQFRLTHNDRLVFDYPRVMALDDRLLQVYGATVMKMMLPVHYEASGVRVQGMTINPYHTRTSRTPQEIFVNRRPVRNHTIAHAIYESYGSFLPKGRHPVFSIMVEIDASEVDVNVHPSKREVKFRNPDLVHQVVKEAIRLPLQNKVAVATLPAPAPVLADEDAGTPEPAVRRDNRPWTADEASLEQDTWSVSSEIRDSKTVDRDEQQVTARMQQSTSLYGDAPAIQIFGQIHATYILARVGDTLHVLDQHTIHERVLFERLWRGWEGRERQQIQIQPLLIPEPVDLPIPVATKFEAILPELAALGLELERMSPSAFVVRSVPSLVGQMDYGALLEDIVDDMSEWQSVDSLDKRVRPVLASIACQGAVQAGRHMEEPEMKQVVQDWLQEGAPMTCPHGRRISLHFGGEELHRMFRRL
ncbi:MAG: DNA mismatch repair endonuclease MutL [Nitrospira sp.]|nr:DNA mismatch repair endonuclease MutL [Nitrospira sp.]